MVTNHETRRRFLAMAGVPLVTCLAGCSGGDGGSGAEEFDEEVVIGVDGDNRFEPEELEITTGTTVQFRWDSGGHILLIYDQPEDSEWERMPVSQDEGHTTTHTFTVPGEYEIYCNHHSQEGQTTIIVEE